jgi:hypothetical protein
MQGKVYLFAADWHGASPVELIRQRFTVVSAGVELGLEALQVQSKVEYVGSQLGHVGRSGAGSECHEQQRKGGFQGSHCRKVR